ncbi:hypothetical protein F4779DRAFT_68477 [Xylariaceae sp. FL0662B]|nr:hypothetical protein F4779DRAFT_68477 [Xylariaceae sp. FL0662B]
MLATVELGGQRALFHNSPRRAPARVKALRLRRWSHQQPSSTIRRPPRTTPYLLAHDNVSPVRFPHWSHRNYATVGPTETPPPTNFTDQEAALLRDIFRHFGPFAQPGEDGSVSGTGPLAMPRTASAGQTVDVAEQFPDQFRKALEAMQHRDTRRLLIQLRRICRMKEYEMHDAVARLPRTTFTEFLCALDPLLVLKDCDPFGETHISVGMYKMLDMESFIDHWGIRKLYFQLLQQMLRLVKALRAAGHIIHMQEYTYLLRCAGAAGDPMGAKWIWHEMDRTKTTPWRNADSYAEFIMARFMSRPLYTNYDKIRRMITPRNLHGSRLYLSPRRLQRIDRLRFQTRRNRLMFGAEKDASDHAKEIMRLMRTRFPVQRLWSKIMRTNIGLNEELLCTMMIALGRAGCLRFASSRILEKFFGIRVTLESKKSTYRDFDKRSNPRVMRVASRMRPTVRMMQAVVETFGSNGHIVLALELIDFISKTFSIPIPLSIWQELLEWTYIMSSPPASTAWRMAGMPSKVPNEEAVEKIWEIMTSAPYNVKPGFTHYNIIIRNLLSRHRFLRAVPLMMDAVQFYDEQCQEHEAAVLEYIQSSRDGVPIGDALLRYKRARFQKSQIWYGIRLWCRMFLLKVRKLGDNMAAPHPFIPELILEFQHFIPNPFRYRTPTGYVQLHDPSRELPAGFLKAVVKGNMVVRWGSGGVEYKSFAMMEDAVLSSHGVDDIGSSKLDPKVLFTGGRRKLEKFLSLQRDQAEMKPFDFGVGDDDEADDKADDKAANDDEFGDEEPFIHY